jgi:hypothetical protein
MKDEAGPLWILLENFFDWLGFWGRIGLALGLLFAFIAVVALITRRKP